jgi:hypothetical protein
MNNGFQHLGTIVAMALTLSPLVASPCRAQEFSADVVSANDAGSTTRVNVGRMKMRLQTLKGGQPEASVIWDGIQKSTTIVMDRDHSYIAGNTSPLFNAAFNASGVPTLVRFFQPRDAGDPCSEWNSAVLPYRDSTHAPPHFACQSAGTEAVNGRPAQKWTVTTTQDGKTQSGDVWIDSRLHVVSKSQDRDGHGEMELRNIQEGPQPDAAFQIPAGYHPVDANALLAKLQGDSTAIADMFGAAAKDIARNAATSTTDAAKQKANDVVKKKIKSVFHLP